MARLEQKALIFNFVFLILLLSLFPLKAAAANLTKIVLLTPPQKFSTGASKPYLRGAEMAVAEWNAREGQQGIKFLLFLQEGLFTQEKDLNVIREIIAKEQAHFLMGAVVKEAILPVSRLAQQQNLPFLAFPIEFMDAPSTGAEPANLFWISPAPEAFQRAAILTVAQFPKKRFYLLGWDSKTGRNWAKYFWEEIKKIKPTVQKTGEVFLMENVGDYVPYLQTILEAKPEVCVSHLGVKEWLRFGKSGKKQGYFKKITHFEMESGNLQALTVLRKEAPEGVWGVSAFPFWGLGWEETKEFVNKYKEKTQSYPGLEALSGYVSIYALIEAMKKGGSLTPEKVLKTLPRLTFRTPIGPLAIRQTDHRALWPIWGGVSTFVADYPFAILGDLKAFGPDSFQP